MQWKHKSSVLGYLSRVGGGCVSPYCCWRRFLLLFWRRCTPSSRTSGLPRMSRTPSLRHASAATVPAGPRFRSSLTCREKKKTYLTELDLWRPLVCSLSPFLEYNGRSPLWETPCCASYFFLQDYSASLPPHWNQTDPSVQEDRLWQLTLGPGSMPIK
jgi:hypothetical protein